MRRMRPLAAAALVALLYALHQDFWFWREARPLVFGFLPIGLVYHAAYTRRASRSLTLWPSHWSPARSGRDHLE